MGEALLASLDDVIGSADLVARGQAPFNPGYEYINSSSDYFDIYSDLCQANTYLGGA